MLDYKKAAKHCSMPTITTTNIFFNSSVAKQIKTVRLNEESEGVLPGILANYFLRLIGKFRFFLSHLQC